MNYEARTKASPIALCGGLFNKLFSWANALAHKFILEILQGLIRVKFINAGNIILCLYKFPSLVNHTYVHWLVSWSLEGLLSCA